MSAEPEPSQQDNATPASSPGKETSSTQYPLPSDPSTSAKGVRSSASKSEGKPSIRFGSPNLAPDCKEAHAAVKEITGDEAKHTVDALSKAYNHSTICGDCNERLGSFLEDVVLKLGVRMPRIKKIEDSREYGGSPSSLKTKGIGPGSVGWDPKQSNESYKVKPDLSAALLSAEELKEKCRLKDDMIEILADELRALERKGRWSAHGALSELLHHPNPSPIDFNRQTLCKYLNNERISEFDDRDEKGVEHFATNPLGLTIVRRIGPDSLLIKWLPLKDPKITCYEIYVNGLLMQRILSPGRNKTLLHPLELDKKITLTLNALAYDGQKEESATVTYNK